jgi:two-component system phosphate regulon response regulator PhoB
MGNRVLVIEDQPTQTAALVQELHKEGYAPIVANAAEGLRRSWLLSPDVILVDVAQPDLDGREICRRLRSQERTRRVAVLLMSERATEADEVAGFAAGADDYIVKPYSLPILLHRIKRFFRPPSSTRLAAERLQHLGVEIDRRRYRVFADGREVSLTASEFRLLEFLLRQPGRAFTRQELLEALGREERVLERSVDGYVLQLRLKLGFPDLIETVRGRGYRHRESGPAQEGMRFPERIEGWKCEPEPDLVGRAVFGL